MKYKPKDLKLNTPYSMAKIAWKESAIALGLYPWVCFFVGLACYIPVYAIEFWRANK